MPAVLMTRKQAAEMLQVSERTLDRWTVEGRIERQRVGERLVRYRSEDVEKLIEKAS